MKKIAFILLFALCLLICVSAKETVIYENDFSSTTKIDEMKQLGTYKGAFKIVDGKLRTTNNVTVGEMSSAYLSYTIPAAHHGKTFIAEYDVTDLSGRCGFVIGATGDNAPATSPFFSGYGWSLRYASSTDERHPVFSCFKGFCISVTHTTTWK